MDKIILYSRVSKKEQDTIQAQINELTDEANRQNKIIVDIVWEKTSAKENPKVYKIDEYLKMRPILKNRIFDRAEKNKKDKNKDFDELWVWKLDRFTRADIPLVRYLEVELGIKLFTLRDPNEPFSRGIIHEVSKEELRKLVERIELKARYLIQSEKKLLNRPCFGYNIKLDVDDKGKVIKQNIIINEAEANIVKDIFRMFVIDNDNIPSISGQVNIYRKKISRILRNKSYIGILTWKKKEYKGNMPRIISDDLFTKAQERFVKEFKNVVQLEH